MKKFVLIPDSFKGTLSSKEICQILESSMHNHFENCEIISIPVADGGEGSVDCFLSALGGKKITTTCSGPFMNKIESFFGMLLDKKTAIIEMASAAGLPLVENNKNPLLTTTYGVGELMLTAVKNGAKNIILGLGGSCTNDFGCGAACACGIKFFDKDDKEFIPVGGTLNQIKRIDFSHKSDLFYDVKITTMCDIDNPPFGEYGASHIFAPQKGASEKDVLLLDNGVKHLCDLLSSKYNVDVSNLSGGGAAGAMGAGMVAFFNSQLKMGINTVLDLVNFDEIIQSADAIFTGEGKIDSQSLRGKVVIGVAKRAKPYNVPVIAIVGGADGDMKEAYNLGVTSIFTINKLPQDFSISKNHSKENLQFTVDNILRTLKAF